MWEVNLCRTGLESTRYGSMFYIESIAGAGCPDNGQNVVFQVLKMASTVRYRGRNWGTPQFEFKIWTADTTSQLRVKASLLIRFQLEGRTE